MHQEKLLPPQDKSHQCVKKDHVDIIEKLSADHAFPTFHLHQWEAYIDEQVVNRAEAKKDERIAKHPVFQTLPCRQFFVFLYSEGVDIANVPHLQLTVMGMMKIVGTCPIPVGNKTVDPT